MESLFTLILAHPLAKYVVVLVVYVSFVRHQRYRRIKALLHKYPDPEIPLRDLDVATEVLSAVRDYEFPFTYGNGLEISLLSTYGIPSISAILAATGQFKCGYLKRSVDGTLLLQELNEGYSRNQLRTALDKGRKPDKNEIENDRLRAAIAMERINFFHRQYNIKQSDYLYTLALFAVGPFLWIDRFEWRKSTDLEKNASLALWAAQGEKMGIQNIPKTFEDFVALVEVMIPHPLLPKFC
ncbi:hypothetical protein BGW38_007904 [Lunasporangiospora selenospora]|uniref:Uncharacterized protein n=1 Tax=Lunasporangiospora selenospora TaxID=979761 RepID=A0A9P6KIR9_9FUNG|nr:hypothetical protein BGW38_007904 [Lunasporangiospora selenospora]